MTNMTFTEREIAFGNQIIFTANRLQYASNKSKLDIVVQLFDRGMLTRNEGREIFNMSPLPDGDKYYIRKEYAEANLLAKAQGLGGEANDAVQASGQGIQGGGPTPASSDVTEEN